MKSIIGGAIAVYEVTWAESRRYWETPETVRIIWEQALSKEQIQDIILNIAKKEKSYLDEIYINHIKTIHEPSIGILLGSIDLEDSE
jgi:hypothetical protein